MSSMNYFGDNIMKDNQSKLLFDNFFANIITYMNERLNLQTNNYANINELIEKNLKQETEISYFWHWLKEEGLNSITRILQSEWEDTDELLDLLEHRIFVFNLDVESGIKNNVFISIANSLEVIEEHQLQKI